MTVERSSLAVKMIPGTLMLLSIAGISAAHDTWILPASPTARPGSSVRIDATSGMAFPALDHPVGADRVRKAALRLAGVVAEMETRSPAPRSLTLSARAEREGIATLWVQTKPNTIELKPAEVREYLEEIGALETAGEEWRRSGSGKWLETYTKHSKTFVRIGEEGDRSWAEPVGMELEIVPETDPTSLRTKASVSFRVLRAGKPLPGLAVSAVPAGGKSGTTRRTDAEGRVAIELDRSGWWLIKGTDIRRSDASGAKWESHFSTLTVFVPKGGSGT